MKQPLYKRLLSYLTEVHIESTSSEYNESLDLFLSKGRYQLCTPNAVYSFEDKTTNFMYSFRQLDLWNDDHKKVLILGFGLGAIPVILEKSFNKNWIYTGVDIDSAVIYLVSKYVLDDLTSEIEIIETDALNYMSQNEEKYDLICLDIFIDNIIPEDFLTVEFMEMVKDSLNEDGLVLFNHLGFYPHEITESTHYFNRVFSKVFPNGHQLKVVNNFIMINDKSKLTQ